MTRACTQAVILAAAISALAGCDGALSPPPPPAPKLSATLKLTWMNTLSVANTGEFDVKDCSAAIDSGGGALSGYWLRFPGIKQGATVELPLEEFLDSDRKRFNPATYKPSNAAIRCQTPAGERTSLVEWK